MRPSSSTAAPGLSWAKVADKLNATGHRTRTGGQWTRQGAHQVHQAREREHGAAAINGARAARRASRGQGTLGRRRYAQGRILGGFSSAQAGRAYSGKPRHQVFHGPVAL